MPTETRQQPGLACEECRKRKARCDRVRPQCGTCAEFMTACVVIDKRPQRGPKKGQLKSLRNRVATLERQLLDQMGGIEPGTDVVPVPDAADFAGTASQGQTMFQEMEHGIVGSTGLRGNGNPTAASTIEPILDENEHLLVTPPYSDYVNYPFNQCLTSPSTAPAANTPRTTTNPSLSIGELNMSDLVRAELCVYAVDQLYFDRVHEIAPIVHKRRYFSWAGHEHVKPARECLRSAMRTMAAAASPAYRSLGEALYVEAWQMLDMLDVLEPATVQLEQIQAGLLLAHYEIMRKYEHKAMLTAGRAFRLVQMMRLYDVDGPTFTPPSPSMTDDGFAEAEEKRRTFWLAFAFDRFLSTRNEWPLTLYEESVCTRLPAPETNFQNSQPIQMDFLPGAVADIGHRCTLSPFAECIVTAALYGRCMTHRRLTQAAVVSGTNSSSVWTQVEWLSGLLEKRSQRLVQMSLPVSSLVERYPMLAFAHLLSHSAIIHLYHTTQIAPFQVDEFGCQLKRLADYEKGAYQAAMYMARLAQAMRQVGCVKASTTLKCIVRSSIS
ncbi:Fc.00g046470.m01.CDS01 [Cosmosporella sp. VM-42]